MKKDKFMKNIISIIFLFMVFFLLSPTLSWAMEAPQENISEAAIKDIPPERTSAAKSKEIRPEETTVVNEDKLPLESTPDAEIAENIESSEENQTRFQKFKNYFSGDLRILTYGIVQKEAKSSQNPDNNFLLLPQYIANVEIRPDLSFETNFLDLSVKPRAKLDYSVWRDETPEGKKQGNDEWYINEWLARLKAWNRIFISYGRENLQWGPSFLFSPSNPFFSDNGRSNPAMEVPGMDFGRVIFVPNSLFSISLIVNTDKGRNTILGLDPFETTYAAKLDFTGRKNYASLIVSAKDSIEADNSKHTDIATGFFGGWTLTDAILIYGEGSFTKGSRALYPQKDDMSPIGVSMDKIPEKDNSDIKPVILAGTSYTFENSGTLYLEYLYNAPGYTSEEADFYYLLRKNAADAFNAGGDVGLLGKGVLVQTANSGLRFLRKNYAMLQYYQGNIKNRLDVTLRWTQNIDDGSGQFLTYLSCSLGNHWELFSSGLVNLGKEETEFGSILNYQVMLGLKFTL